MAQRQDTGNKRYYLVRAIALAGGPWGLLAAAAYTLCINVLALTGPGYMLLLYGRVVPSGNRDELIVATLVMVALYGLCATAEIARQKLIRRSALRLDRGLSAIVARRLSPLPARELYAIRNVLAGPAAASLCDVPFIPLYVGVLLWLHPMLCALALAGSASIAACMMLTDMQSRGPRRAHGPPMVAVGILRVLRLALPSVMLGGGSYLVMAGDCHPGSAFAAVIVLQRMLGPIEAVSAHWRGLAEAHASTHRLLSLLSVPEAIAMPRERASHGKVRIVLRRGNDYARRARRGGATSASSDLRPTAQ